MAWWLVRVASLVSDLWKLAFVLSCRKIPRPRPDAPFLLSGKLEGSDVTRACLQHLIVNEGEHEAARGQCRALTTCLSVCPNAGEFSAAQTLDLLSKEDYTLIDVRPDVQKAKSGVPSLPRPVKNKLVFVP